MNTKKILIGIGALTTLVAAITAIVCWFKFFKKRTEVLFREEDLFDDTDIFEEEVDCSNGNCECPQDLFVEEPTENIAEEGVFTTGSASEQKN